MSRPGLDQIYFLKKILIMVFVFSFSDLSISLFEK